jgi:pimeloyl-ACP methyl ester carboxylesterase
MHLYCAGTGSPTVILEGGLGRDWISWQRVQPEVAKTSRVCSYDRAGLGFSDPQPGARDAKHIAEQLHALLQAAGEKPPYILTAASAGGFYARQFTADFPTEIVGIVFVDSSVPAQVRELHGGAYTEDAYRKVRTDAWKTWTREILGWSRLRGECNGDLEPGFESFRDFAAAEACRPSAELASAREWHDFWISADEAAAATCCQDLPSIVISQDPDRPKPGWTADAIANQPIWVGLQESLKSLSPRSRRVVARNSPHHVASARPDVVISAIKEILAVVQTNASPRHPWGTTVVE